MIWQKNQVFMATLTLFNLYSPCSKEQCTTTSTVSWTSQDIMWRFQVCWDNTMTTSYQRLKGLHPSSFLRLDMTSNFNLSSMMDLLPSNRTKFYRYNGSLTTPLCNEAVTWTVFANAVEISAEQVEIFRVPDGVKYALSGACGVPKSHIKGSILEIIVLFQLNQLRNMKYIDTNNQTRAMVNNHRPLQALHGRMVLVNYESSTGGPSTTTQGPTTTKVSNTTKVSTTDGAFRMTGNILSFYRASSCCYS